MHKLRMPEADKINMLNILIQEWRMFRKHVNDDHYVNVLIIIAMLDRCFEKRKYRHGYDPTSADNLIDDASTLIKKSTVLVETLAYLQKLQELHSVRTEKDKIFRFDDWDLKVTFETLNDAVFELEIILGEEEVDNMCGDAWAKEFDEAKMWEGMEIVA